MGRKHFEVKPKLLGACNMVLFLLGLAVALRSAGLESYMASPHEDSILDAGSTLRTTAAGSNPDHLLHAISILSARTLSTLLPTCPQRHAVSSLAHRLSRL